MNKIAIIISSDYETFKVETYSKSLGMYEKYCNIFEKYFNLEPDKKLLPKIKEDLYNSHLNCSPKGVISLSAGISLFILIIGALLFLFSSTIGGGVIILGISCFFVFQKIPSLISRKINSQSQDQIILSIFYIVAFMRFSSNFERAIQFAAIYLPNPLSMDFKRVLWELENSKYPNIKQAFDKYLEKYREDNLEFLESIYLIESGLFESDDFRRISLLDKSLDLILQSNFEKMMHFSQILREKISSFNMLGIVLPILGLIILPLAASMSNPKGVFEVIFILYDFLIPILVFYFAYEITISKPSSFNSIKIPSNYKMPKYKIKIGKNFSYKMPLKKVSILIFFTMLFIGLIPLMLNSFSPKMENDICTSQLENSLNNKFSSLFAENSVFSTFQTNKLVKIEGENPYCYGPYGLIPAILSLFIPLSFAFAYGFYLKNKFKDLIHLRDKTKKLEKQFPSAIFQLGNIINEGISGELSFGKVSETMKQTVAGDFFSEIDKNIKFNGMGIEKAIFDSEKGAINKYPSELVLSSMKIFIRAQSKGPEILAKTLIDLSKYLTQIHMGQERMKDLISESVGSMKSQVKFLAPLISSVVVAIVFLITLILGFLGKATEGVSGTEGIGDSGAEFSNILGDSIPTYFFQAGVGMYIVFLVVILSYLVSNLENGDDEINRKYDTGLSLIKSMTKYAMILVILMFVFGIVGSKIAGEAF